MYSEHESALLQSRAFAGVKSYVKAEELAELRKRNLKNEKGSTTSLLFLG